MEPNDTTAQANDSGAVRGMPAVIVTGGISAGTDLDLFYFDVPAGQTATLDVVSYGTLGDVDSCGGDNEILLLDSMGMEIAGNDDPLSVDSLCGRLNPGDLDFGSVENLAAGRYYIQVQHYNMTRAIPQYFLNIQLTP
jgi:hypothetical protein